MKKANIKIGLILLSYLVCNLSYGQEIYEGKWSIKKVDKWYSQFDWVAGTNFGPSTAINQLEMWQKETFDPETIDRELRWSAELGFNTHRVYLHNLVWEYNSEEYLDRIDQYLSISDKYDIKTIIVLLDNVWDPNPKLGKQIDPVQGKHNSGWVQSPGREYLEDESKHPLIEGFIKGLLQRFKYDNRILFWDLYNEPSNTNDSSYGKDSEFKTELDADIKVKYTYRLAKKVFQWAREVNPSQPLSMGIWFGEIENWGTPKKLPELDRMMLENSDIITFHAYDDNIEDVQHKINELKKYGRPMICTEYLARGNNNHFKDIMPLFKKENIGAINWGFVAGKTNTIYPWSSWPKGFKEEPEVWFHDILRKDGTPFSEDEVKLIKSLTKKE